MISKSPWLCVVLLAAACGGREGSLDGDDVPTCCDASVPDDGGVTPDSDPDAPDGGPSPDADPNCVATGDEEYGDGVDNDCDGFVDEPAVCMSGGQAFTSIAAAIAVAPSGATIDVCGGTYRERLTINDRSVRLRGTGAESTVLDAGDAGPAVTVAGGHAVTIEGMTIKGGYNPDRGGGIYCADASLTVKSSALTGNEADVGGGGLFAFRCTLDIQSTRFEGNDGAEYGGGAMLDHATGTIADSVFTGNNGDYGGALYLLEGDVDVMRSELVGNRADGNGGAVYQKSNSTISDSNLSNNYAGWIGGAVYVFQHAPTFDRVVVDRNEAYWEGGGFYIHQGGTTILDSRITSNKAFDDGGGLRLFETASRLERNVIASNVTLDGDGGGFKISHWPSVFIDNQLLDNIAHGAGGGAEFDNCSSQWSGGVIARNDASIGGGVHTMLWPYHDGKIENVQILDNHAHRGGGMYHENNFQPVLVRGVLVKGNTAFEGAGVYTRGTPLLLTNSVIIDNTASGVGGGFFSHPSSQYPWTKMCPCPPIDPAATIRFTVFHGNDADSGQAIYIGSPHLTFSSNIISGHSGTAIEVAPTPEPLPPPPPPEPAPPPPESRVPVWTYNDTYPATFVGMSNPTGSSGNISSDPDFMAPDTGDFHLDTDSACEDKGDPQFTDPDGSRADMGAYGGPDPMP